MPSRKAEPGPSPPRSHSTARGSSHFHFPPTISSPTPRLPPFTMSGPARQIRSYRQVPRLPPAAAPRLVGTAVIVGFADIVDDSQEVREECWLRLDDG